MLGLDSSHPTCRRPHIYVYIYLVNAPPRLCPCRKQMPSFGGEDDPNIRELVERMQKYHDEVEQEFTGQKVRRARGGRGWRGGGKLSSVRFSSYAGLKRGAVVRRGTAVRYSTAIPASKTTGKSAVSVVFSSPHVSINSAGEEGIPTSLYGTHPRGGNCPRSQSCGHCVTINSNIYVCVTLLVSRYLAIWASQQRPLKQPKQIKHTRSDLSLPHSLSFVLRYCTVLS